MPRRSDGLSQCAALDHWHSLNVPEPPRVARPRADLRDTGRQLLRLGLGDGQGAPAASAAPAVGGAQPDWDAEPADTADGGKAVAAGELMMWPPGGQVAPPVFEYVCSRCGEWARGAMVPSLIAGGHFAMRWWCHRCSNAPCRIGIATIVPPQQEWIRTIADEQSLEWLATADRGS